MFKISLPWLIETVRQIERISELRIDRERMENLSIMWQARSQLHDLYRKSLYGPHLRISSAEADALDDKLQNALTPLLRDETIPITEEEILSIQGLTNKFFVVFYAELGRIPSFVCAMKPGLDLNVLVDDGRLLYPTELSRKVPEAEADAKEAARALAFELHTACGFHIFRVTEAVVKRYWSQVSDGVKVPKTLGGIAEELISKNFGDFRIAETIKQVAKLHRNPVIHPESTLDAEEALTIIGISRSLVSAILRALPDAVGIGAPLQPVDAKT